MGKRIVVVHVAVDADTDEQAEAEVEELMANLGFAVGGTDEPDRTDGSDSGDVAEFREVGGS